mmetsp:Transcript_90927/g.262083  ORF Transcript_90927/g.262083 Transcript_90927/m.262083 type:complete len:281 (+) Transcript_90927:538-1380(+)
MVPHLQPGIRRRRSGCHTCGAAEGALRGACRARRDEGARREPPGRSRAARGQLRPRAGGARALRRPRVRRACRGPPAAQRGSSRAHRLGSPGVAPFCDRSACGLGGAPRPQRGRSAGTARPLPIREQHRRALPAAPLRRQPGDVHLPPAGGGDRAEPLRVTDGRALPATPQRRPSGALGGAAAPRAVSFGACADRGCGWHGGASRSGVRRVVGIKTAAAAGRGGFGDAYAPAGARRSGAARASAIREAPRAPGPPLVRGEGGVLAGLAGAAPADLGFRAV